MFVSGVNRGDGALAVSMAMHTDDLSSDDDQENRNTVGRGKSNHSEGLKGRSDEDTEAFLHEARLSVLKTRDFCCCVFLFLFVTVVGWKSHQSSRRLRVPKK